MIDDFLDDKITFGQLLEQFKEIEGEDAYDLTAYHDLLEHAKQNPEKVKVYAGSMPIDSALKGALEEDGIEKALAEAK